MKRSELSASEQNMTDVVYVWGLASESHDATKGVAVDVTHLKGIKTIACGGRTTCAISSSDQLWTWGYSGSSCFGFPVPSLSPFPALYSSGVEVHDVSVGQDHAAVISADKKLYTFGTGSFFRLGLGGSEDVQVPQAVGRINSKVLAASCGGMHTSCVTANGFLWTWGFGKLGALGHGDSDSQEYPKMVNSIKDVVSVANGREHTLVLTKNGDVYSCGYGGFGALGHGNTCNLYAPTKIAALSNITQIGAGAYYSIALSQSGTVWTWGSNEDGVLGHPDCVGVLATPKEISSLQNITSVASGYYHAAAVNYRGEVYVWGNNDYGKLGTGDTKHQKTPTVMSSVRGVSVCKVSCGMASTTIYSNTDKFFKEMGARDQLFEFITWSISQGATHNQLSIKALAYYLARPKHDLTNADKTGKTFLHHAAMVGNVVFVRHILANKESLNVNAQDSTGSTPLHLSLKNSHTDIARLIVENGGRLDIADNSGFSAANFVPSQQLLFELKQLAGVTDVFLSYSTHPSSAEFTRRIYGALEGEKVNTWMDEKRLKPGDDWLSTIKTAISQCHSLIFVVSSKSVESQTCKQELQEAIAQKKRVFPVILEHVHSLNHAPFNHLKEHQWVDFSQDTFDHNIKKLITGIKEYLHGKVSDKKGKILSESAEISRESSESESLSLPLITGQATTGTASSNKKRKVKPINEKPSVFFIHEIDGNEFFDRMYSGITQAANQLNLHLEAMCSKGNRENMIKHIGKGITSSASFIIINLGGSVLLPAIDMAINAGIKILTIDLQVLNPLATEVQQDDFALAHKLCQQLILNTDGNSNVIYLSCPAEGFMPLLKRHKVWENYKWCYSGLNEISRFGTVNATVAATSRKDMHAFLKQEKVNTTTATTTAMTTATTTAILAMWDQFAIGAVDALYDAKVQQNFTVYSIDISNQVIEYMHRQNSPWKFTVAADPKLIGNLIVRCGHAWLNHLTDLGKYVLFEPTLISREFLVSRDIKNMDQLVAALPSWQEDFLFINYPFLKKTLTTTTTATTTAMTTATTITVPTPTATITATHTELSDEEAEEEQEEIPNYYNNNDNESSFITAPNTTKSRAYKPNYYSEQRARQQQQQQQRQQQRQQQQQQQSGGTKKPTTSGFFSNIPFC